MLTSNMLPVLRCHEHPPRGSQVLRVESTSRTLLAKAADVAGLYIALLAKAIALMRGPKSFDPGFGASAGLSLEVAQWPRLAPADSHALQAAWHDNTVCSARSRYRKYHRGLIQNAAPRPRSLEFTEQRHRGLLPILHLHVILTTSTSQIELALAQDVIRMCGFISRRQARHGSIRSKMVLDLAGAVAQRRVLHKPQQQLEEHIDA